MPKLDGKQSTVDAKQSFSDNSQTFWKLGALAFHALHITPLIFREENSSLTRKHCIPTWKFHIARLVRLKHPVRSFLVETSALLLIQFKELIKGLKRHWKNFSYDNFQDFQRFLPSIFNFLFTACEHRKLHMSQKERIYYLYKEGT